ncbi:alpha/beta hydrolase [Actinoplanes sp. TRM 88003]|uniref:Alpha/beta hydrolase n=1 Tax=Paractinoplanes aksuensis TaxID=2939490 RepID=A0ABT1DNG4_9ACTN|nr:alpha/beta hydrolase [Actinoplanes aksuensis]MCO8271301.1 alpha/beta hydrolase [Actinoplanes aksuensis]
MPTFSSYDGTLLAYHVEGSGPVLVCQPGGPGRASVYLGDLGGLTRDYTVIRLDSRGTGDSATPSDPATYRMDALVPDLEALRVHLGLETMALLGHSAGANVVTLYAADHPERVERLILLTGLVRAAGLTPIGMEEAYAARSAEPWYADAVAAWTAWDELPEDASEEDTRPLRLAGAPFSYGRWNAATEAHATAGLDQFAPAARDGFFPGYTPDRDAITTKLSALTAPVLVVAGELDVSPTPAAAAEAAKLFPSATLVTIPGSGHFPWVDNPADLTAALTP